MGGSIIVALNKEYFLERNPSLSPHSLWCLNVLIFGCPAANRTPSFFTDKLNKLMLYRGEDPPPPPQHCGEVQSRHVGGGQRRNIT